MARSLGATVWSTTRPLSLCSGCLCRPQRLTLQCTLTPAVHPSEGPPAEDPCPRQNGASGARPGQGGRTAVTAARSGVSFLHQASLGPRQTCDRPPPTPGSRDRAVPPHEPRGPGPRFCPQLRPVQRAGPDRQRVPRMPTRPAPSRPLGLLGGDWAEGRVPRLLLSAALCLCSASRSPRQTHHLRRTRPASVPTVRNGAWYTGVDGRTDGRTEGQTFERFDRQAGLILGRRARRVKGEKPRVLAVGLGRAPGPSEEPSPVRRGLPESWAHGGCPRSIRLPLQLSQMTTNIALHYLVACGSQVQLGCHWA